MSLAHLPLKRQQRLTWQCPVLHDIGMTVAIGTFLTLFFAASLSAPGMAADPAAVESGDQYAPSL